jgi:carbonic anhydrase
MQSVTKLLLWGCALAIGIGSSTVAHAAVQSPINITSYNTYYNPSLPAFNFNYSSSTTLDVHNTGSPDTEATVKAIVGAGAGSLTLSGTTYDLLQFHFHAPAEHLINGVASALELHFVHQSAGGELLVVGQLFEVGAFNSSIDPIFSDLPLVSGDQKTVNGFNLNALLPSTLTSFRYDGSLTTSPYTGGVKWNVLTAYSSLSQTQLDGFLALFPNGDSREEQDFDGFVMTDLPGFSSVPEPTSMAIGLLCVIPIVARARQKRS